RSVWRGAASAGAVCALYARFRPGRIPRPAGGACLRVACNPPKGVLSARGCFPRMRPSLTESEARNTILAALRRRGVQVARRGPRERLSEAARGPSSGSLRGGAQVRGEALTEPRRPLLEPAPPLP